VDSNSFFCSRTNFHAISLSSGGLLKQRQRNFQFKSRIFCYSPTSKEFKFLLSRSRENLITVSLGAHFVHQAFLRHQDCEHHHECEFQLMENEQKVTARRGIARRPLSPQRKQEQKRMLVCALNFRCGEMRFSERVSERHLAQAL
jgi:hypothetical protein